MIVAFTVFAILLSSCSSIGVPLNETGLNLPQGTQPALVFLGTQQTDACASIETKKPEIEKIIRFMGKFDETSFLVINIPMTDNNTSAFVDVILVLQETQRDAAGNNVPDCLQNLKETEINYMNAVILTSIGFMANNSKPEARQRQLQEARRLRELFEMEVAKQLGLKYVTATPAPTAIPTIALPTSTLAPVTSKTINDLDIFVFQGPGTNYPAVGTFMHDQTTNVIGRNEAGDWLAIDVPSNPGNVGWVPKEVLALSGDFNTVPVVETPPTPEPIISQ
jgi:hypothetical protein